MKVLSKIFTFLAFLFLYAPLLVMVFFSFNSGNSTFVFKGFSLKWYDSVFSSSATAEALQNTLILALTSAVIATILGTIAAVGIQSLRNKWVKGAVKTVTNIPMMNPDIVTGVSLMLMFALVGKLISSSGDYLSFWTVLCAHITFNLPYVILNVQPKLRQLSGSLTEAALDLGCTPFSAFFKVVLPNITSGIFSGFIMAFSLSMDDFIISQYTTGSDFQTLPLLIYSKTKKAVKPDMYALSTIIFVSVLVLLILTNVIQAKTEKKSIQKQSF